MFINGWQLEQHKHRLIKDDNVIQLTVKSCALIKLLYQTKGEVISRDELLSLLWEGVVVSDDSLTNLVSVTRQLLKEYALEQIIKTIPKQGYLLNADLAPAKTVNSEILDRAAPEALTNSSIIKFAQKKVLVAVIIFTVTVVSYFYTSPSKIRLAVIPLSFSSNQANISQQFDLALYHQVSQVSGLETVASAYVKQVSGESNSAKQSAEIVAANYWLEGNIDVHEEQFLLTVQLVSTNENTVLFSQKFEGKALALSEDVTRISHVIATNIRFVLQQKLSKTSKYINGSVANERCENYLEIAGLYAESILVGVNKISQAGEQACHNAVINDKSDVNALNNLANWYLLLAKAHTRNENSKRSYLILSEKYGQKLAMLNHSYYVLYVFKLSLEQLRLPKVNFSQVEEILANNKKLFNSIDFPTLKKKQELSFIDQTMLFNYYATSLRYGGVFARRQGKNPSKYFSQSEKLFTQALLNYPEQQNLLHNFARLKKSQAVYDLAQNHDPQTNLYKAIELYKKSLVNRPNTAFVLNNLANAYSMLTKWLAQHNLPYQEALKQTEITYQQSLANSQKNHQVYNNIADLYAGIAQYGAGNEKNFYLYIEQGLQASNNALTIKPDYDWPLFNQGHLYYLLNRAELVNNQFNKEHYKACKKTNEKALARRPNIAQAHVASAQCEFFYSLYLLQSNDKEQVEKSISQQFKAIEQALTINNKLASAYSLKAKIHLLQYKVTDQVKYLYLSEQVSQQAYLLSPSDTDVKVGFLTVIWSLLQHEQIDISADQLHQQAEDIIASFDDNELALKMFFQQKFKVDLLSSTKNSTASIFDYNIDIILKLTKLEMSIILK